MIIGSKEWHLKRRTQIGCSALPTIVGVCPYGNTPYSLWAWYTDRAPNPVETYAMRHGKRVEPIARARYIKKTGIEMREAIATHRKIKYWAASLDGRNVLRSRLLEIKCPISSNDFGTLATARAGKVIGHYIPQVQGQLACDGSDRLDFQVYHEETGEEHIVPVYPDLPYQKFLEQEVEKFWDYVQRDMPPPLTEKDTKIITDKPIIDICKVILANRYRMSREEIQHLLARIVHLAKHPTVQCGMVKVSTVKRLGKFSHHNLLIGNFGKVVA